MGHQVSQIADTPAVKISAGFSDHGHEITYGTVVEKQTHMEFYAFPEEPYPLPAKVDLRQPNQACYPYPPIQRQHKLGTCTSIAATVAMQCLMQKQKLPYIVPSVLYNYYYARGLVGNTHRDSGTSIRAALDATGAGVPADNYWPYHPANVNLKPSLEAQKQALHHSTHQWNPLLPTLHNLRRCVAAGYPFLFSFFVTTDMDAWFRSYDQQLDTDFQVQVGVLDTDVIGGHTVLVVGYDDGFANRRGAFLCRNSWSAGWGQEGHFWISYNDILSPQLSSGFFAIREVCSDLQGHCVEPQVCKNVYGAAFCSDAGYENI